MSNKRYTPNRFPAMIRGVGLALAVLLAASAAQADDDALEGRHLRVQGQGTIQVSPTVASVHLGVEERATSVATAMAANNRATAAVLEALRSAGIDDRDIVTAELNVHRVVERPTHRERNEGAGEVEYCVVRNLVQARIRNLEHLGQVIDAAIAAGANEMRSLQFGLLDDREARDAARAAAVDDAKHRAEELARLLGVSLGKVLRVSEFDHGAPRPQVMMMRMAADESAGAPVSAGDLSFRAGVEVIFALKD